MLEFRLLACPHSTPADPMVKCALINAKIRPYEVCRPCQEEWVDGTPPRHRDELRIFNMAIRPRALDDGSVQYPKRGSPPPVPEGWCRDPGDPYRLVLDVEPCKFRKSLAVIKPCGKIGMSQFCSAKGIAPTERDCNNCQVEDRQ